MIEIDGKIHDKYCPFHHAPYFSGDGCPSCKNLKPSVKEKVPLALRMSDKKGFEDVQEVSGS